MRLDVAGMLAFRSRRGRRTLLWWSALWPALDFNVPATSGRTRCHPTAVVRPDLRIGLLSNDTENRPIKAAGFHRIFMPL